MTSLLQRAAAVVELCGTAMRGQPVSMADHWSLMMSEVPLMSSLTGGEGRGGESKWNLGLDEGKHKSVGFNCRSHKEMQVAQQFILVGWGSNHGQSSIPAA